MTARLAPLASRLKTHRDSLLLFAVFLALYIHTLAPGLLPADSGEFQIVTPLLGVAHPPGFSLYILLGKLFTGLVRVGDYAYRLNLFSAFTSALTLAVVHVAVKRLAFSPQPTADGHQPAVDTHQPPPTTRHPSPVTRFLSFASALLPPILLGLSTTFWSQATTANIRSLMTLLTALAALAFIEYRRTPTVNRLAFFLFALSLAVVHHLSIAFIAVVLAAAALALTPSPRHLVTPKNALQLALAALLPLTITLYLPLRGAQNAYLAPPGLDTLNGFIQHALGLGFGGDFFYFANPVHWPDRFAILFNIFQFQFNDFALVLLALGLALSFFNDWKLASALTLALAVHCFVAITYRAPQTVEYLLPAYVMLTILAGAGLGNSQFTIHNPQLTTRVPRGAWTLKVGIVQCSPAPLRACPRAHLAGVGAVLIVSLFIASVFIFIRNYPAYKTLAADDSTRAYAAGLLTAAPPNALILANWHQATPLWYLQHIEGLRPDVEVEYVFPQGESLAQNWVERIEANASARPTLVTSFYPTEFSALPYRFLPILTALPAWEASPGPLTGLGPEPAAPTHENGWAFVNGGPISLHGLDTVAQNETFTVQTFWQAPEAPADINFFVQLLGPDGLLYGQADVFHPAGKIAPYEVISDRVSITVNADAPIAGDYSLVAGAYLPDGRRLAPDVTEIASLGIVPRARPPATRHPQPFGLLAGYDLDTSFPDSLRLYLHWRLDGKPHKVALAAADNSPLHLVTLPPLQGFVTTSHDLPSGFLSLSLVENNSIISNYQLPITNNGLRYISFGPLTLVGAVISREPDGSYRVDLDWLANEPITGDYVIKVDLAGENHAWRAQSDSIPAGGAIPTLKWIPGIIIRDRHRLNLLQPTPATFQLAVYDHFTQRNLPILDARLAQLGPTVPLGTVQP